MEEAIDMLCDTVKTTLGPKGANVIINKTTFSPFITNDGVTIAESIESEDKVINTILEIAKEASIKTNETSGDGTTTTLVLLQSIFKNGLLFIRNGVNPMVLKKELNDSLEYIVNKIKDESRVPNDEELKFIAEVSASDSELGKIISDAYLKTKNKDSIIIKEGNGVNIKVNHLFGYIFDSILASSYFLKDLKEINYNDAYLLLIDEYINDLECLSNVINYIVEKNKTLIIIAKDYDDEVINNILSLNIDNEIKIILLKNPEYGNKQISILKDLSSIANAKVVEKTENIDTTYLGLINKIKITNDKVIINFISNKDVEGRVEELKSEIVLGEDNSDIYKRISMFTSGIVEIIVGEKTITERKEKKMRCDDSLCAIDSASSGVVPGGGLTFLKVCNTLDESTVGNLVLKKALLEPFNQILFNAGVNIDDTLKIIKENNYEVVFNLNNLKYENIQNTKILDPTNVVINSLTSAVSIASMLLSTTSIVVNEYANNLNKINEYTEI
ncbi:MAG: hypothetical protein IJY87_05500 [Bacilli bacterium]|nr:hypothetical protein [Bacilli bacterium]